jgi:hypothetical protein
MMRSLGVFALVGAVVLASAAEAHAVPSYVRQTGLTCNQCHMTWTPNPDFTFTGEKFRLNGYRTPFVAERLEAGEEGALNGKRLLLGLNNYWSFHYRSTLLSQSKSASDPRLSEPDANPVGSQPFGSLGLDYAGPIGDHWGIWTEYYFAANGGNPNVYNMVSNDEYDVKYVFNPGDNIVGMAFTTQSIKCLAGFCPFSDGTPVSMQRSGAGGNGHAPYANIAMYGLWNDRLLTVAGVRAGDDNLDYQRMNYEGVVGLALGNTDYNRLWIWGEIHAGNDMVPQISSLGLSHSNNSISARDAVRGVSATNGGTVYASSMTGDMLRTHFAVRGGFIDKGPYSFTYEAGVAMADEKYSDGATVKATGIGARFRFFYDRTYGIEAGANKRTKYDFTDVNGVVHDIPSDMGWGLRLIYRPAMNFAWELAWANSQAAVLDQNWRNGWSWSLSWHFLY